MRWMSEQLPQGRYLHCPNGSHAPRGSFSSELTAAAERAGMIPSTMAVYIKK
jgi:hypothetical protein